MGCELDYSKGEARRVNLTMLHLGDKTQDSVKTAGAKPEAVNGNDFCYASSCPSNPMESCCIAFLGR